MQLFPAVAFPTSVVKGAVLGDLRACPWRSIFPFMEPPCHLMILTADIQFFLWLVSMPCPAASFNTYYFQEASTSRQP